MVATTRPVSVDLPRLSSVVLEEYAFFNVQHVELRSGRRGRMRRRLAGLELDEGALLGDPSDERRGAMEPPYDYRNDAVLESGGGGAL